MKKKVSLIIVIFISILVLGYLLTRKGANHTSTSLEGAFAPAVLRVKIHDIPSGYPLIKGDTSQVVTYSGFHLSYNESFEQANWSAYILTSEMISYGSVDRTDNFRTDTNILTGSAVLADYRGSGFDRGHLAPAAAMKWSEDAMNESFYMSNMSPQVPQFNRQIWRFLEAQVREWAIENDSIYVITGPFLEEIDSFIGSNRVGVPNYYFKVILDISSPSFKGVAFLMENRKLEGDIFDYAICIDSLEKFLNYDFFPEQDPQSMEWIESHLNLSDWQ